MTSVPSSWGAQGIVNLTPLLGNPPTVTTTLPVFAPAGTFLKQTERFNIGRFEANTYHRHTKERSFSDIHLSKEKGLFVASNNPS
jgi:hypothetical protein